MISWFVDLAAVRSGLACCISSVAVWVAASWSRVQLAADPLPPIFVMIAVTLLKLPIAV